MNPETLDEFQGADAVEALLGDDLDMLDGSSDQKEKVEDVVEDVEASEEVEDEADEVDDPEGEDEGDDPEDSDEEDESDEPEVPTIDDETLVDIQIGDDTYEVNFAELRAGYLRNEDYVNKVQSVEAEYDSKLSDLEIREAELAEELRLATVMITGDLNKYDQVNWAALKDQDPAKYQELRLEAMEARDRAQAVTQRRQKIQEMHNAAERLRHEAYVRGQVALAETLVPGFRDPDFLKAIMTYGKDIGYTEDDIKGISDARHLLLLNNSRLYAESVVRRKEAMEKKVKSTLPPVAKPGVKKEQSSTDRRVVKNATARLHSEKSVDAAAALLMTLDL